MDVLIFVALPNYFIKKQMERERVCDTSIHHSIEQKKSYNLMHSTSTKTWIMIEKVPFTIGGYDHENVGKSRLSKSLREHSGMFQNDLFSSL